MESAASSPSSLTYKERLALKRDSGYKYTTPVFERLLSDATTRQTRARSARPYRDGATAPSTSGTISGFASNSCRPSSAYAPLESFKPGHVASNIPVESLHPMVVKHYKQKFPLDFLSSIRPDTQTINQTMRMLGTYQTDYPHAQRLGMHIPASCPGGPGSFHPDVTLTQRSPAVSVHPAWATSAERFGFAASLPTAAAGGERSARPASARPGTTVEPLRRTERVVAVARPQSARMAASPRI